jgi:hypothetical protein
VVVSREEIGQVFAEIFGGFGLGFLAGMEEAVIGMGTGTGSAATASIGEGVKTHVDADL